MNVYEEQHLRLTSGACVCHTRKATKSVCCYKQTFSVCCYKVRTISAMNYHWVWNYELFGDTRDLYSMETMGTVEIMRTLSLIHCFQSPASPLVGLDCCLWNEKIHSDLVFTRYFVCRKQKSIWTRWNERFIKRNGHTSWTPWKKNGGLLNS